jgi:hypothetical protein
MIRLTLALIGLLLVLAGCTPTKTEPRPAARPAVASPELLRSLPGLLLPGEYRAEVLELVVPPRLEALSAKTVAAMQADPKWTQEYVRRHATKNPGGPLPFHPKLGLTQAEHEEFLALADEQQLAPTSTFPLTIARTGDTVRFRTTDYRHRGLNELEIDLAGGRLRTPIATVPAPVPMPAGTTGRNLGPWKGVDWHHESGDPGRLTGQSTRLSLGHTPETGHVVIEYRLNVINAGLPVRREAMLFRFPSAKP